MFLTIFGIPSRPLYWYLAGEANVWSGVKGYCESPFEAPHQILDETRNSSDPGTRRSRAC